MKMQPDPDFIHRPLAYKAGNRLRLSYSVKIEKKNIRFRFVKLISMQLCSGCPLIELMELQTRNGGNAVSGRIAQLVEHLPYRQGDAGSSLVLAAFFNFI